MFRKEFGASGGQGARGLKRKSARGVFTDHLGGHNRETRARPGFDASLYHLTGAERQTFCQNRLR